MNAVRLRWAFLFWSAWAALAVVLTWPGMRWHLEYFAGYGPRFRQFFPVLIALLAAGALAYQFIRKRGLWRYEPAGLAGLATLVLGLYQPRATLFAVWTATAAFALGRATLGTLRYTFSGITEEIVLASAVGLEELILSLFVLGLLHLYYAVAFTLLLGLPCLLLFPEVKRLLALIGQAHQRWAATEELRSPLTGLAIFFSAVFLVFGLIVILSPSLIFDSLVYHLAGARFYAETHALTPLPFQPLSHFPQGFEVLMAMGYGLGGQPAAQMISPLFFVLALLVAFALARRCGISRSAAVAGLGFVASMPYLHWSGSEAKNDFAMAFFVLCALETCLIWRDNRDLRWIYLSVFFLAAAFGIKHTALFAAVPLGVMYIAALRARSSRWRSAALLALLFLATGTFWQVRTFVLTGNPVYPFHPTMIAGIHSDRPASTAVEKLTQWLETPWRAQFEGSGPFESKSPSPLGAVFVFFLPAWLWARPKGPRKAETWCLFFSGLYLLYWSFEMGWLRFAIAPVVLLLLFTVDRLVRVYKSTLGLVRFVLAGSLFYCGIFSLCVLTFLEIDNVQLKLLLHQMDWTGYLRTWPSIYRPLEYLKGQAQPGDLILSVDDCAAAYAPDLARFHGMCRDDHIYSPDAIRAELGRLPYRFLILPRGLVVDPALRAAYQDPWFAVYPLGK
jgi:hypothetical protein